MYENRDNSGKERESKEKNKRNKDRKGKWHSHKDICTMTNTQASAHQNEKKGECIVYL